MITREARLLIESLRNLDRRLSEILQQLTEAILAYQSSAEQQANPQPHPPTNVIAERSEAEISRSRVDQQGENVYRRKSLVVQWALFLATLAAFGAAAYYARIAAQQKDVMAKQLTTMQQQFIQMQEQTGFARQSAAAAVEAAKAATASIEESRKNRIASEFQSNKTLDATIEQFRTDQRAWVSSTGIEVEGNIAVGQKPLAWLMVLVSGKTPAIQLEVRFRMDAFCGTFPKDPQYRPNGSPSIMAIAPGVPMRTGPTFLPIPISQAAMDMIGRPKCNLYVYGKIIYQDVFRRPHWRRTCNYWLKGTPNMFANCSFYSEGDEEYPDGNEPN